MLDLGHNIRVFVEKDGVDVCVAAAMDCSFHIAVNTTERNTKDTVKKGVLWSKKRVVSKSWDVSCNALYDPEAPEETNAITPAELAQIIAESPDCKVKLRWDGTDPDSDKNRTAKNVGFYGEAILADLSIQSAVNEDNKAAFQFQGDGPLEKLPKPVVPPTPEAGE